MGALSGKVALITGAGGGLGEQYALLFAREGAKVVVNDLGGSRDGTGGGSAMADQVVAKIKAAGGEAVANYASVSDAEGAQGMVDQAVEAFGGLDIVVNNAGILRDKTLVKMDEAMWDLVMEVHAKGTFLVTKAAVVHMRSQGRGGRIINTSSYAGLKGNFGQANYGTAKAGIAGFTRVVALETRRHKITVNCIAPAAKTRMTEDIDAVPDAMQPEDIAPLVAWLASDDAADVTGRVFGAHGKHYFEYRAEMTDGVEPSEGWSVADVGARFGDITRFEAPAAAGGDAAEDSADAQVKALIQALPSGLKADKAKGWSSTIHFNIEGTGLFGVKVVDGSATFLDAPTGKADGTVTFSSAQVLLDMASGALKPEAAFMSQKLKSDNMSLLMSFGKYFDLAAAAKHAAGGGGAAPAATSKEALVDEAFRRMGEAFVPEKAEGWTARLNFKVGDGLRYAVYIDQGEVKTKAGADEAPTCTITFASIDTFLGTISGKVNPQKAFMAGQIGADNMGELMRYAQCFDMRKAAAAAKAATGGSGAASGEVKRLNRDKIGVAYRTKATWVKREHTEAYARATEDLNPAYVEGDDVVAPPMYAVRPLMHVAAAVMTDDELNVDMLRLVHGEQDMRFMRPLKPWDLVAPRAKVHSIDDKSSGQLLKVKQVLMCDGEVVCEAISGYFIRAPKGAGGGGGAKKAKAAPAPEPERDIVYTEDQEVAADQPLRYADASLDHNPIHTDPNVAKAAGHPSIILHGLCSMAFAAKAVINGLGGGDPARLKRLKVRFTKPVLPGWVLTTRVWSGDNAGEYGLEVVNQDGVKVITHGLAEVAPE